MLLTALVLQTLPGGHPARKMGHLFSEDLVTVAIIQQSWVRILPGMSPCQ